MAQEYYFLILLDIFNALHLYLQNYTPSFLCFDLNTTFDDPLTFFLDCKESTRGRSRGNGPMQSVADHLKSLDASTDIIERVTSKDIYCMLGDL